MEKAVSKNTRYKTTKACLTATVDCHGETPAQEPDPAVVVVTALVVVSGVVEEAGGLVVAGVVDATVVVVVGTLLPLVNAFFTETSYLLLAMAPVSQSYQRSKFPPNCKKTRTIGLGHVPQHHTTKRCILALCLADYGGDR